MHTGHLLLSRAVLLQGRLSEAKEHIDAGGAPEHLGSLAALARLRAYQGDRHGAERILSKPAFAEMPSVAGAIYAIFGDHHKAEEHFTRAPQRKDPNLPYLLAEPEPRLDRNTWLRQQAAILGVHRG